MTVAELAAALLPGGAGFPGGCATGMVAVLQGRLDAAVLDRVAATADAAGLEAGEPRVFAEARKQAYLAYYEEPLVIAAIRALGHPYNDAPLPDGYPDDSVDQAPAHGRGRWVAVKDAVEDGS